MAAAREREVGGLSPSVVGSMSGHGGQLVSLHSKCLFGSSSQTLIFGKTPVWTSVLD